MEKFEFKHEDADYTAQDGFWADEITLPVLMEGGGDI